MGDKLYSDIEERLKKLESDTQYVKAFLKYLEPTMGDVVEDFRHVKERTNQKEQV